MAVMAGSSTDLPTVAPTKGHDQSPDGGKVAHILGRMSQISYGVPNQDPAPEGPAGRPKNISPEQKGCATLLEGLANVCSSCSSAVLLPKPWPASPNTYFPTNWIPSIRIKVGYYMDPEPGSIAISE
ncbi:hypothetical protein DSO57_1019347 [Entomophthora muscae]|uniref:Uncharacterized protein n=1 Tax=Entomophthora muscae TaxID=34485 RepID=A0ACC2T4U2_9FUNG|nr:hypothetical protein DSO57_1019347 [Entomophthora muscae]